MSFFGPVECLLTGEAGLLPDGTSAQQYCSQYGDVDRVEKTDEGLLNYIPTMWSLSRAITSLHGTHHLVDGHRVAFHLLRPDVYCCDVTVTRHRVSVTVGDEVIRRMKQDETYKEFTQALPNRQLMVGEAMVCFLPNQIEVLLLKSLDELPCSVWEEWEWELCVLQQITAFLKPFKDQLPQTIKHTSYRERCMDQECRKETSQSKDLDTNDGESIAVFQFTHAGKLQVAASEDTLKQLRQSYPTIYISCDTGMKTLTLRGPARAMYEAREDMCSRLENLTTQMIKLESWKRKVLNNPDARKRIEMILAKNNILCFWEIGRLSRSHFVFVEVTASRKDQPRVKQVLESSVQAINIPFDENQKSSLQSDAWKLCLEGLQTSKEGEPAPVVDVGVNEVFMRGLTVSVESARRAVLEFFHRNVVQTYPQLYGQNVEEVITGLKPWQIKLLTNTILKERIVAELPDLALLNVKSDSPVIQAPLRVLTESVSLFWRFVASLSQREIHLTTALAEMYKQPAARSKVQTLLKAAGLPCKWEVEDDHITVSAEDADQEPLKQIFTLTFSEASVHVAPEKSHLLRSEDFQALVTELQERTRGSPAPLIQISPSDSCVIIVDDSKSCAVVQRAIKKFIENHDVLTSASQKETQTQSPKHENFAAQTEVEEIQTEERHRQIKGKNFRSTEQQTDNRHLESKEQQTQDNSSLTVEKEQQTERPRLTENGFQTDKITTKEQQLQTDQSQLESTGQQTDDSENKTRLQTETRQLQSNEKQLQKTKTNSETRRTQTEKQQPENQPMQTQREHQQTQTDESENKNHEQSLHERMETQGTQTTSPDFKNKKQASPQTERTPADEEVAPSEQANQRRMQRSNVQSDSRDCPADHQHHYPRHDNVGTAQYTCQEDIKTGGATQEDSSETFPKYICDSQQGQRTPPQDHATPSGDIVQQRLLCLTVEQLLEVATHLGIGQQTLHQLHFSVPAHDDPKRQLTEKCRATSDTHTLLAVLGQISGAVVSSSTTLDDINRCRHSQSSPMAAVETEQGLSATCTSVETLGGHDDQAHIVANMSSSFSTESQMTTNEPLAQSYTDTHCRVLQTPRSEQPQPLNSVDPVDLTQYTEASSTLFDDLSAASEFRESEYSTTAATAMARVSMSNSTGRLTRIREHRHETTMQQAARANCDHPTPALHQREQRVAVETTLQLQLNSAIHARLSQIEHRNTQIDDARARYRDGDVNNRSVVGQTCAERLEIQMSDMQAQLQDMMCMMNDLYQQQMGAEDDPMTILNASDTDSSAPSLISEPQARQEHMIANCYTLM